MEELSVKERLRLNAQSNIDMGKLHLERNKLGQFATPSQLAIQMLTFAKQLADSESKIRFLDPAFGTGAFYSALLSIFPSSTIDEAVGFEIDSDYVNTVKDLWASEKLTIYTADFLHYPSPKNERDRFSMLICNPPYVRHQHIKPDEKIKLNELAHQSAGIVLSRLAGLYCYFLLLSHSWMRKGALAGWLIPSEILDVNYGKKIKDYLLEQVNVLRIHRFDSSEIQFDDALVSSTIIWFKNEAPQINHMINFSYGGTLLSPAHSMQIPVTRLQQLPKWSFLSVTLQDEKFTKCLGDFFKIKRGVATGANHFFIINQESASKLKLPSEYLKAVLPPPRCLKTNKIEANQSGQPLIDEQLFLVSSDLPEESIKILYPSFWQYLEKGKEEGITGRYICKHRSPWYSQERRPPATFLFNIIGRCNNKGRKPFRFILNKSLATATNNYLMLYPKPTLAEQFEKNPKLLDTIWNILNEIPTSELLRNARTYGGDMYKLEPSELARVCSSKLSLFLSKKL